jgi:hypothetical protein
MILSRFFRGIALALVAATSAPLALADTHQFEVSVNGEKVRITLSEDRFDGTMHRFERGKHGQLLVDGFKAVGTDSLSPQRHLSSFKVEWNGHNIPISRELFEYVFNPSLERKTSSFETKGSVLVLPSETGSAIFVQISGGDGAGSFNSWWIISKAGQIDRFIDGPP